MSSSEYEQEHNQQELQSISGKPRNVEISALRTIEAYKEAYREKGIVPTSKDDFPRSDVGYRQVQRLLKFDSIVKKDKGIKKVIRSMVIQPVTVEGKTKLALYYSGGYIGKNAWDDEIYCSFNEGYYYKPKLTSQVVNTGKTKEDFDENGERRRIWKPVGYTYEHYIFLSEQPKERRKFLEELIKESPGTEIANCIFSFRQSNYDNNHTSQHDNVSWNNFCDLNIDQLSELQGKRYYKEGSNLKDKDGYVVSYRDGKIQAIV